MCRLAAWFGPSIKIEELILTPSHSLVDQSQAATESKFAVNGDGYGFAWYAEDGRIGLYRDVLPAWGDSNLASLASMITSRVILAHVRASTFGENSRSNCHPFVSGCWSFMHNGQIGNFAKYRRKLENDLSDSAFSQRVGNTDSELLFLLLLSHGLNKDVTSACQSVLELIARVTAESGKPNRISAVFSDGRRLFALRTSSDNKSPSLYIGKKSDDSVLIASEPLDRNHDHWSAIEENTLFWTDLSTHISTQIGTHTGKHIGKQSSVCITI